MTAFQRPSAVEIALAESLLTPLRRVMDPRFYHLDRVPEGGPLLFVGNHTLGGMLDVPHFFMGLLREKDIFLRSLGDHFHFRVPIWGEMLARWGAVDGTRENCMALLQAGEPVLVFPGGAREVAKRKGERYQLVWKNRLGFARMAASCGATIVPFGALGGDDAWEIVMDADDLRALPIGGLIERAWRRMGIPLDSMIPVVRGIGPTPLPRPVRLYFSFADPVPTAEFAGQEGNDEAMRQLRDRVAAAIEVQLEDLQQIRAQDPRPPPGRP